MVWPVIDEVITNSMLLSLKQENFIDQLSLVTGFQNLVLLATCKNLFDRIFNDKEKNDV